MANQPGPAAAPHWVVAAQDHPQWTKAGWVDLGGTLLVQREGAAYTNAGWWSSMMQDWPRGAQVAFWVLFIGFLVGEYVLRIGSRRNRAGARAERASLWVVVVTFGGGIFGGFELATWDTARIGAGRWPLFGLGLTLMAAGTVLRHWAVRTLGRFFTVDVRVHADQTVVQRGPYRWVRHPSYTGLVVFLVGLGLALGSWAALALVVLVPTAGIVVRIHAEERALLAGIGEPYQRYAATHRRLLPGIW